MSDNVFSRLPDDVVLNIFFKLEEDPQSWASLACVSTRLSSLIRISCCKSKCSATIPSVVSDLLSPSSSAPPGGWSSLHKLAVCCPGLIHSGVLLDHSDFGLHRDLGPDQNYRHAAPSSSSSGNGNSSEVLKEMNDCGWSLFDDLLFDTVNDTSESSSLSPPLDGANVAETGPQGVPEKRPADDSSVCGTKRRKVFRLVRSHLASGVWNLSREQGNKLLASRFKGDCLYICDWPGCIHTEEKRNYMLFRGLFKNFKRSRVWRTINDGNRKSVNLNCAFCSSNTTWDLHSAFCLRRYFGYHEDGEPVVRAYVCENGHVSGAWTDWPLYT